MTCSSCSADMALVPCSSTKSKDSFIWYCSPCQRSTSFRTGSVLSGRKLTFKSFLLLIFFLSCKGVANVLIAQLINISENTISDWRQIVYANVARYFLSNPVPLGGPGVIVELVIISCCFVTMLRCVMQSVEL